MADVLLVCVSDDAEPAEALAQRLESEGFSVGGVTSPADAWSDCRAGIILWSPASTRSGAFLEVAHAFISARKAILVSTLEDAPRPQTVEGAPFIDMSQWALDQDDPGLDEMCAAIDRLTAPSWRRWLSAGERQEPDFIDIYMARRRSAQSDYDDEAEEDPRLELVEPQSFAAPAEIEAREEQIEPPLAAYAANENAPSKRRASARMMLASAAVAIAAIAGSLQFNAVATTPVAQHLAPFAPAAAYAESVQAVSLQDVMAEHVTIDNAASVETTGWARGVEPASMPTARAAPIRLARATPIAAPSAVATSAPVAVATARRAPQRTRATPESAEWLNRQEAARLRDLGAEAAPVDAASS